MAILIHILIGAISLYVLYFWFIIGNITRPKPCNNTRLRNKSKLGDLLAQARVEWPNGECRYFVPIDEFEKLVTFDAILTELEFCRSDVSENDENVSKEFVETVFRSCRKLFAILDFIGKANSIRDFLKEGIRDEHLPFLLHSTKNKNGAFRLFSETRDSKEAFDCTENWDRVSVETLFKDQWSFLAPVFKRTLDTDGAPVIEHYVLHSNSVLPFVDDMEHSDQRHEGGFSTVWEVKIHPAHHTLLLGRESKVG